MKKVLGTSLLLLFLGFATLALGSGTIPNAYCFSKPAGDPSGGDNCKSYSCYTDGILCYCHVGVSYNKCGQMEGNICTYSDGGIAGAGGPICAYKYMFATMKDCLSGKGSISQTFYSFSPNCN